jgi:hypothetical protein
MDATPKTKKVDNPNYCVLFVTFQNFKKYYNFDHCLHPLVAPCTMFAPIYEYPSIKVDNLFVLSG